MFDGTWGLSRGWEALAFTGLIFAVVGFVYVVVQLSQKYDKQISTPLNKGYSSLSDRKSVKQLRIITIILGGLGIFGFFNSIIEQGNATAASEGQLVAGVFLFFLAPPILVIYGALFLPWEKFSESPRIVSLVMMVVILSLSVASILANYF